MMNKHEQILAMLDAGKSHAEICTTLHCSMSSIQKAKLLHDQQDAALFSHPPTPKTEFEQGFNEWLAATTPTTTTRDATLAECNEKYKIQMELQRCRIRRYLLRSLAGCKKATGMSASDLTLWLEMRL